MFELAHFVGVTRPGYELADAHLPEGAVTLVEVPALAISSTDCRDRVRPRHAGLVPRARRRRAVHREARPLPRASRRRPVAAPAGPRLRDAARPAQPPTPGRRSPPTPTPTPIYQEVPR